MAIRDKAILEVTNLRKTYGSTVAVDDVSFSVEEGEVFGILGPNGAGKTTAVECVEGLRRRDGGEIRILGHDPQPVLAPSVAGRLIGQVRRGPDLALSPREVEVLRLVAAGTTNRETARRLLISEATVKTHLLHLYEKLGVNDRAAAVSEAYQRGLLS